MSIEGSEHLEIRSYKMYHALAAMALTCGVGGTGNAEPRPFPFPAPSAPWVAPLWPGGSLGSAGQEQEGHKGPVRLSWDSVPQVAAWDKEGAGEGERCQGERTLLMRKRSGVSRHSSCELGFLN